MSDVNKAFRTIHEFRTIIGNAVFSEVAVKTNRALNREELTDLSNSVQTVIDEKIDHLIVSLQNMDLGSKDDTVAKTKRRKSTK